MVQSGRLHRYTYADYVALEEYDTTTKPESYQTIPSLKDYLVVSHRERRLTLHTRAADGSWVTRVAIAGGKVVCTSVPAELLVDEIYRGSAIA